MSIKTHGGLRSKSGRKKISVKEKKVSVATYHRLCDINLIGGMDAARIIAANAIENKIKKT